MGLHYLAVRELSVMIVSLVGVSLVDSSVVHKSRDEVVVLDEVEICCFLTFQAFIKAWHHWSHLVLI